MASKLESILDKTYKIVGSGVHAIDEAYLNIVTDIMEFVKSNSRFPHGDEIASISLPKQKKYALGGGANIDGDACNLIISIARAVLTVITEDPKSRYCKTNYNYDAKQKAELIDMFNDAFFPGCTDLENNSIAHIIDREALTIKLSGVNIQSYGTAPDLSYYPNHDIVHHALKINNPNKSLGPSHFGDRSFSEMDSMSIMLMDYIDGKISAADKKGLLATVAASPTVVLNNMVERVYSMSHDFSKIAKLFIIQNQDDFSKPIETNSCSPYQLQSSYWNRGLLARIVQGAIIDGHKIYRKAASPSSISSGTLFESCKKFGIDPKEVLLNNSALYNTYISMCDGSHYSNTSDVQLTASCPQRWTQVILKMLMAYVIRHRKADMTVDMYRSTIMLPALAVSDVEYNHNPRGLRVTSGLRKVNGVIQIPSRSLATHHSQVKHMVDFVKEDDFRAHVSAFERIEDDFIEYMSKGLIALYKEAIPTYKNFDNLIARRMVNVVLDEKAHFPSMM